MMGTLMRNLQKEFNDLNSGISMCLSCFADSLAEYGLDEFYRFAHGESSNHSSEAALKNDLHFLRLGMEGIGNELLNRAIALLKEASEQMVRLDEEYRCCSESITKAEEQWQAAAKRAKQQLVVWEAWVIEAEIRWRKRSFPWSYVSGGDRLLRLRVSFDLHGASAELESPQRLQKNLTHFETQIKKIQAAIPFAYINGELPEESSITNFYQALNDLKERQAKLIQLEKHKAGTAQEFNSAEKLYCDRRNFLTDLLRQLQDEAQWALFRIYHPDLRESHQAHSLSTVPVN